MDQNVGAYRLSVRSKNGGGHSLPSLQTALYKMRGLSTGCLPAASKHHWACWHSKQKQPLSAQNILLQTGAFKGF